MTYIGSAPNQRPDLVPVELHTRRLLARWPSEEAISGLISVGIPVITTINPMTLENGILAEYVRSEAETKQWLLLHLVFSVHQTDAYSVDSLGIGVSLHNPTGTSIEDRAIAWMLHPTLSSAPPVSISDSISVTAKLGVIETQASRKRDSAIDTPFVQAFGQRESEFEWRFQRTTSHALLGIHSVYAVIRCSKHAPLLGKLVISAEVASRRFGVFPARALLPEVVSVFHSGVAPTAINDAQHPQLGQ